MTDKNNLAKNILLIARIGSVLSIAFLLFMIGGHLFGAEDNLTGFNTSREILLFICFPVSTLIGLAVAWKKEGLGGLITVLGLVGFHLIGQDFYLIPWIDGLAAPGFLFLIYWFLSNRNGEKNLNIQTS